MDNLHLQTIVQLNTRLIKLESDLLKGTLSNRRNLPKLSPPEVEAMQIEIKKIKTKLLLLGVKND